MIGTAEDFASIEDFWKPRTVGGLNGQLVELVRRKGGFEWRKHAAEDVMPPVFEGAFAIRRRDRDVDHRPGEFFIIPRGVEHMPVRAEERRVTLSEPAATKQYGD